MTLRGHMYMATGDTMPTKLKEPAVTPPQRPGNAKRASELPAILAEIKACIWSLQSIGGLSPTDRERLEELRQKIAAELSKA